MNYNVLKEVTIGGTKGDKFTKDIKNIYAMFDETLKTFVNSFVNTSAPSGTS